MSAILTERAPGPGWTCNGYVSATRGTHYQRGAIRVISSLIEADLPDGSGVGWQWHVSVSTNGKRPHHRHLACALREFGMIGAEEDNHHPGNARHFWKPVDAKHRVACECKVDEQIVVDPDGYQWTNPRPETGAKGRPCPVHSGSSSFSTTNEGAKSEPLPDGGAR